MAKKLYIGNLSYGTTEQALRTAFGAHGEVSSVSIAMDRDSGRPRGFAFVEMATEQAAQTAINALNATMLDGREIKVAEANPPKERGGGGGYRGGSNRDRGGRW